MKRVRLSSCLLAWSIWGVLISGLLVSGISAAELVLSAPPRETPQAGHNIYSPLAERLTELIGVKVTYVHPGDWRSYERNMKKDVYDIVFDGPHFAAWRIQTLSNRPLVKLPGALRFVLVVKFERFDVEHSRDLVGKEICTLPAPNLGALTLFSMFPHPARQPLYRMVNGGFKEVAHSLEEGRCIGAILRSSFFYNKTSEAFRESVRVVQRSKAMTNQGITVSERISPALQKRIVKFLTTGEGVAATRPILDRFYSRGNAFVKSSESDYVDQNLLTENSIYGW